jgi:hypothetical protein
MSDKLQQIADIANKLVAKNDYIRRLEAALDKAKDEQKFLAEIELPQAMGEVRMTEFRLTSGFRIKLKPLLVVNYIKDKIDETDDWLAEHGYPGMVKTQITINIPKGTNEDLVAMLESEINEKHFSHEKKKTINWQTLNAWGREMEREDNVIPEELFTVYRAITAIVE